MRKICTSPLHYPPSKRKQWLYLSHPRRVFDSCVHIHPIPAGFSIDMAILTPSPPGFAWHWPYSPNPRRFFDRYGHIRLIPAGFSVNMAIFIPSPPGFQQKWLYSSDPRRVFGENGHICPILGEFCVKMAIFVQFPTGFTCAHTNFKSHPPRFAWHWLHPLNPRRVSQVIIQILGASRRCGDGHKDIHSKTCQVLDTPNKWESNF